MKRIIFLLLFFGLGVAIYFFFIRQQTIFVTPQSSTNLPLYESVLPNATVSIFQENIGQVTNIKITPDNHYMLVATLSGTVWVYQKVSGVFEKQIKPFFIVQTAQPGFPPREAGLTGMFFGADFDSSGDVFFTYSYVQGNKDFRNRVTRVTFRKEGDEVFGRNPEMIFEANTPGNSSHQIQDGVGVMISGRPHILFSLGEGFTAKRALDPALEAGKLILIKRDGLVADGKRPFPSSPKVQAIGIRNSPPMAYNADTGKIMIADTGPNNYDRLMYGKFFDANGENNKELTFNWDGTESSLLRSVLSPFDQGGDAVLYRWAPTQTAVSVAFYNNDKLPTLGANQQYVLVTMFGKTGSKSNEPGKKILLGTIYHGIQDRISLAPFIQRAASGEGKLAHPIGLAVDNDTKNIYFGDIMERNIYQVSMQ